MAITLKQADGSRVTPTDDARLYELLASGAEGIVSGCSITHKGGRILHITSGWGIAQGRCFSVTDQDITIPASSYSTQNGRLFVRIEPAQSPAVSFQTAMSSWGLPALTKEAINYGGMTYELELATYNISEAAISMLSVTVPRVVAPGGAVFKCTFRYNNWSSVSSGFTQTVACPGMLAEYYTHSPEAEWSTNLYTNAEIAEALSTLNTGVLEMKNEQVTATVTERPTCDITVYLERLVV